MSSPRRTFFSVGIGLVLLPGAALVTPSCEQGKVVTAPGKTPKLASATTNQKAAVPAKVEGAASAKKEPSAPAKKERAEEIKVEGTLHHPVYTIGGETTGTEIETSKGKIFELDLSSHEDWRKQIGKLDGKSMVITGTKVLCKGVEGPDREIITVSGLEAVKH